MSGYNKYNKEGGYVTRRGEHACCAWKSVYTTDIMETRAVVYQCTISGIHNIRARGQGHRRPRGYRTEQPITKKGTDQRLKSPFPTKLIQKNSKTNTRNRGVIST